MIEQLPDLPDGVLGFEAVGEVQASDYENTLRPAVDAAAAGGNIRLVYVLGERFEGFSAGAGWQDTKMGIEHFRAWDRLALVSDLDWVEHVARFLGWMVPGDFEHFRLEDLPAAIEWAAGGDAMS